MLLNIAFVITMILWLFLAGRHWWSAAILIAVFFALAFLNSKLLDKYEQTGQAIRIPRPLFVVSFPGGTRPLILRVLRASYFVLAAALIALGLIPLAWPQAKIGMITIILCLFAVGVSHAVIEARYTRKST